MVLLKLVVCSKIYTFYSNYNGLLFLPVFFVWVASLRMSSPTLCKFIFIYVPCSGRFSYGAKNDSQIKVWFGVWYTAEH